VKESEPNFTGNESCRDNETADDSDGDEICDAGSTTPKQIISWDWVWQTLDESYTTKNSIHKTFWI
jgi:hypothetical protein